MSVYLCVVVLVLHVLNSEQNQRMLGQAPTLFLQLKFTSSPPNPSSVQAFLPTFPNLLELSLSYVCLSVCLRRSVISLLTLLALSQHVRTWQGQQSEGEVKVPLQQGWPPVPRR